MNTITGKQKNHRNVHSLTIPPKEGNIDIYGYRINSPPAEVEKLRKCPQTDWLNLNDTIWEEAIQNRLRGQVDIVID